MLPNINSNMKILEKVLENYLESSTSKKLGLLAFIYISMIFLDYLIPITNQKLCDQAILAGPKGQ